MDNVVNFVTGKNTSLALVEKNANEAWKRRALQCLFEFAATNEYLTADDVERRLRLYPEQTHDRRALGAIFRKAAKYGYIAATDEFILSTHPSNHRCPRRKWRSLLYTP